MESTHSADFVPPLTPPIGKQEESKVESGFSLWGTFKKALNTGAHYAARGTIWTLSYNCDFEKLENKYKSEVLSIIGEEGFSDLEGLTDLICNAIDINKILDTQCKDESWYPFAKELVTAEKSRVDKTIHATILGATVHLAKFANMQFPHEALDSKQNPQDFFCKLFIRIIDRLGLNLKGIETIEAIDDPVERKIQLENLFKTLSKQVCSLVFPKGIYEIEIPGIAQWYLSRRWINIVDNAIPNLLLQAYQASRAPHEILEIRRDISALPKGTEVLELSDKVSSKVALSILEYLKNNKILGEDWNYLGDSLKQFFSPQFGFKLKSDEKVQELLNQSDAILEQLKPFEGRFEELFFKLQNFVKLKLDSKNIHSIETKDALNTELNEALTSLKTLSTEIEGIIERQSLATQSEDIKKFLQALHLFCESLKTDIESRQAQHTDGEPIVMRILSILNSLEKVVKDNFSKTLYQIELFRKQVSEDPKTMSDLIVRRKQTEDVLKETIQSLLVKVFKHLVTNEERDLQLLVPTLIKKLVALTIENIDKIPSERIVDLQTFIQEIDQKLQKNHADATKAAVDLKARKAEIKQLRVEIQAARGNPEAISVLISKEMQALAEKNLLVKQKRELAQERSKLSKERQKKIELLFKPFSLDLLKFIGFEQPQTLPLYSALQETVFDVLVAQANTFLFENVYELKLLSTQKSTNEDTLKALQGGESVITLIKEITKNTQNLIKQKIQKPEELLSIVSKSLKNNGIPLSNQATLWLLEGANSFSSSAEDSQEAWNRLQGITESLLMKIMAIVTAGEPGTAAVPNLIKRILATAPDALSAITIEQMQSIENAENPVEKQKMIHLAYQNVSKVLLKSLGIEKQSQLPVPEVLKETVWGLLNEQLDAIVYEMTQELKILSIQESANENTLRTLQGGESVITLVKELTKSTQNLIKQKIPEPEKLFPTVSKSLQKNGIALSNQTTLWLLDSAHSFSNSAEDSQEAWNKLQGITESLLMKVLAIATAGEPGTAAVPNLIKRILETAPDALSAITIEQMQSIENAENPVQKQEMIHLAYQNVSKTLLKLLELENQSQLPVPERFKETVWGLLNEQLDAIVYEMTAEQIKQVKLKKENIAFINTHPEGKEIIAFVKDFSSWIQKTAQEKLSDKKIQQKIVDDGAFKSDIVFDAATSKTLQEQVEKTLDDPKVKEFWPEAKNLIEAMLFSVIRMKLSKSPKDQPFLEGLLTEWITAFKQLILTIPEAKLKEVQTLLNEIPTIEAIRAIADPEVKKQKIKERKEKSLQATKSIDQLFGPATQRLLLQLGYESLQNLPLPEKLRETIFSQINSSLFEYHSLYFGMYSTSSKILEAKTADKRVSEGVFQSSAVIKKETQKAFAQEILDYSRDYFKTAKGEAFLVKKLGKIFNDTTVSKWLVNAIQKSALSRTESLPLMNEAWKIVTVELERLLQDVFTQLSKQAPQLIYGVDQDHKALPGTDPKFMMKMAKYAMDQVNIHLKETRGGAVPSHAMSTKDFSKKFSKELIALVMPNGVQGLPVDDKVKKLLIERTGESPENLMETIESSLAETLEEYFGKIFDPAQRQALFIKKIETVYSTLDPLGRTPESRDPKKLIMETIDLATKLAFSSAWKTIQTFPNQWIGKVFGAMGIRGKEKLDAFVNTILSALFGALLTTILYPIVVFAKHIWNKQTGKFSEELLKLIATPENKFIQDMSLSFIEILKGNLYPDRKTANIDKEFETSCKNLCKTLSGFNFGITSSALNLFSSSLGKMIASRTNPHLKENALEGLVDIARKAIVTT